MRSARLRLSAYSTPQVGIAVAGTLLVDIIHRSGTTSAGSEQFDTEMPYGSHAVGIGRLYARQLLTPDPQTCHGILHDVLRIITVTHNGIRHAIHVAIARKDDFF